MAIKYGPIYIYGPIFDSHVVGRPKNVTKKDDVLKNIEMPQLFKIFDINEEIDKK